ncbi:MAG: alpha-glucosidase C-terminal domain-containing protein, partial [Alphaproteobacteria bacterium]|nr:alpha-glucosidase C-terminal domain-containing protein [Alphaproteobacteria bacterium]
PQHQDAFAKFLLALLTSQRGSVCLYQGEELGLPEADIPFEKLQDPYGIRFWPEFKGRDGCRTPMPWEKAKPHAGFTAGEPWLPVPAEHSDRAVDVQENAKDSLLHHYRAFLAWRNSHKALRSGAVRFFDAPDGVLAFTRTQGEETILCIFNLVPEQVRCDGKGWPESDALEGHGLASAKDGNALTLPPYGVYFGKAA